MNEACNETGYFSGNAVEMLHRFQQEQTILAQTRWASLRGHVHYYYVTAVRM